jgi:neutral ceramidase
MLNSQLSELVLVPYRRFKAHAAGLRWAPAALLLFASTSVYGQTVPPGAFRVGGAKVDITPGPDETTKEYTGVLDHVYARAIVIDNGHTKAALVSVDAGAIPNRLWNDVSERAEKSLGIPAANLLMTATHSHAIPSPYPFMGGTDAAATPGETAYEGKVFDALQQAAGALEPARISYGTGVSYLNVQRDMIDPDTHRWWEGANYGGLSDHTVAVIRFEKPSGEPIALYYNYAMHAVITGVLNLVSGDVPGAASRYIESHFDDKVVALWSEGAAGDQNPVYFQQTYDLRAIRIKDYANRGIDISNAMPPNGEGMDRSNPEVRHLMEEQKEMANSMGQMLGEEVLHVVREKAIAHADGPILGRSTTISCPGRVRTNTGRGGYEGTYKDGPPVQIRLGLLMIDDIAIGAVNGEVYNLIAQRLKSESPYRNTMMATLTDGIASSGYIPDDASFGHNTFEVLSSRLMPGCAETSIVDGIIGMMPRISY